MNVELYKKFRFDFTLDILSSLFKYFIKNKKQPHLKNNWIIKGKRVKKH